MTCNSKLVKKGGRLHIYVRQDKYKGELSDYFINKFTNKRSVINQIELPEHSDLLDIPEFDNLTFKQGCIIVGILLDKLGAESKK